MALIAPAQAEHPLDSAHTTLHDKIDEDEEFGFRQGSFMVAPIPFKNPLIGSGLALGGAYLFQSDAKSKTSYIGLGALKSDNGTTGYGLGASLAWAENRWQLSATAAEAEAFYDLFVLGLPIPLRQQGEMFNASLLYGFNSDISFGLGLRYLDTTINLASGAALPPTIAGDAVLTLGNLSLIGRWDTRDDSLYPRSGFYWDTNLMAGTALDGLDRDYRRVYSTFSLYHSLGEKTVIAGRAALCGVTDEAPFFDKCALGGIDAMRGFPSTQYYDLRSASLQVELRQRFGARFGAVVFAGAGMTGPDFGAMDVGGVHKAGGVGLRFQLTKKFETDFSVDVSLNDEDEELVYIYVGQRF
ncbi:BamA/TamA family outer membrane protein [Shimia sp. SDUM112013]|uniref:BamA/TamA family outer membrane protein n=1 Tax=Shimia sp. SDUM112013 TaxID=3136160 RepID=UPI0032ED4F0D